METVRINKRMADLGIVSRREADTLIASGKVLVNGAPAEIGQKVSSKDKITLKQSVSKKRYFAYYKGRGVITHSPGEGEVDIVSKLKKDYGVTGVSPIGRLDKDSEGLIILSDDGRITAPLLNPDTGNEKEYDVTVDKDVTDSFLRKMEAGVDIEGYITKPAKTETKSAKHFLLTITEGKKHQIRRMCVALGYQVQSLKRVRIANIELGNLKPNQFRKIKGSELNVLLDTLGVQSDATAK